jgi:hypothetical protein
VKKRKTHLAMAFISMLLLSAAAGTQFVSLGKANPLPMPYTNITIESPQNTTYPVNTTTFIFFVETDWLLPYFFYSLDGQQLKSIENMTTVSKERLNPDSNPPMYRRTLKGSCVLSNLSEGWHNITVYQIYSARGDYSIEDPQNGEIIYSANAKFIIDTTVPSVSILSLKNETYYTTNVTLAFAVNEPTSWLGYSLDGQDNVTISGNTPLTGLSYGAHTLTVYAIDAAGNIGSSETIYFSVEVPFPTIWIIVAATAIVATGGAALVYFVKAMKTIKKGE